MSISNLFESNDFDIKCNSITFESGNAFEKYTQLAYTTNLSGPYSATGALGLTRQLDRFYAFSLAGSTGTSTAAAPITLSTKLQPAWTVLYYPIWVIDSGTRSVGTLKIGTDGQVTIYKDFNSNFTNSGTCGFEGFSISYCSYLA